MKRTQKVVRGIGKSVILVLTMLLMLGVAGCQKQVVQVFQYEETASGTITITGLTEKGRNDSTLTIPSEINQKPVTAIGAEAFRDDSNVTAVTISESVLKIGENAFLNCTQLEEIHFPEGLQEVGTNIVKNTLWEKKIFETGNEIIIGNILAEVKNVEGAYTIPEQIRVIASGVFYCRTELTEVQLPEHLEVIHAYAFAGCTGLTEVNLPESVWSIGYGAFEDCTMEALRVPQSVKEIGANAFAGIERIYYEGEAMGSPWGAEQVQ